MLTASSIEGLAYKHYIIAEPADVSGHFQCFYATDWIYPLGVSFQFSRVPHKQLLNRFNTEKLIREFNEAIAREKEEKPVQVSTRPAFLSPLFSRYERCNFG